MTDQITDANKMPQPDAGWSRELVSLDNAIVLPPSESATVQKAGVLDRNGKYCAHGAVWRGSKQITVEPDMPDGAPEKLSGRWLYSGLLWVHFGHFLAESTSRFWAIDRLKYQLDGILFIPKRPAIGDNVLPMHRGFLDLLDCELPIKVVTAPTEVEHLEVPGQGFGLGGMVSATPEYRKYFEHNFGKNIKADGPEKLYISRSALGPKRGGIMGEKTLEENLIANGYEVFHPQHHPMDVQIARYKAAKKIVALDGSALHLFALVGRSDQSVVMIPRRTSNVHKSISSQITAFCGNPPLVADAIITDWVPESSNRPNRSSIGELDMTMLANILKEHDFIDSVNEWKIFGWRKRNKALRILSTLQGFEYKPIHRKGRGGGT